MRILLILAVLFVNDCKFWNVYCENDKIESRLQALENLIGSTCRELRAAKDELSTLQRSDEKRNFDDSNPVMFTAQLKTHAENLGDKQPIKFDHIVTNDGSGYDPVTGVFTSPTSGNFLFSVTLMCRLQDWVEAQLVVNGIAQMSIYAGSSIRFNQGTSSVIVRLDAGDRVWVETFNNIIQGNNIIHIYGYRWSSFSGIRVSI